MAKKWGKRGKARKAVLLDPVLDGTDPRNMFGMPPARRNAPPASSTPLADYLAEGCPGVGERYVVLPRSLAEAMPLPWQQQLVTLLAQFHGTHRGLSWPTYRVVPSRPERLVDLDEEQLAEAGYLVEIDAEGELVYRERSGRKVADPEHTTVLVSCLDPVLRHSEDVERQRGGQAGPVPMNIGPQPVWRTTTPLARGPEPPAQPPSQSQPPATEPAPDQEQSARDWFDDDSSTATEGDVAESSGAAEFGPTGDEPTQLPYRHHG
ncbi:hypothetical protein FHU38_004231 [Saccharomonospora amisosensis]|uniref:Uncharacterized protein n=1 Tax=Saccharomonospora amisosensis TaxID=1128677 RepID=A0A7X5ZSG1_9PSEU|nr:hypothetical protein [Saccharomonospora amisosensis]NIJ13887.1 hypothetical protein [Saccharomonospora amisosensis]